MNHKEKLHYIWETCNNAFKHIGPVFIAGGAPRNVLMDCEPKDYDVFILSQGTFVPHKEDILRISESLKLVTTEILIHRSEPFLATTLTILGESDTQIMVVPYKNVDQLIDSFDWNVCLFAYDGANFICREDISNIGPGKELKLNKITFPRSTLRRGYRFSERFKMKLPFKTVDKIIGAIYTNKSKKFMDYSI